MRHISGERRRSAGPGAALAWMVEHDKSAKLLRAVAKNPNVSSQTLAACQNEYAHRAYAEYARNACSSQKALTIKVGNTPSVQAGSEGVWLTVKLWVTGSNAASMQTGVSAHQASQPEADVSAPELVAVAV